VSQVISRIILHLFFSHTFNTNLRIKFFKDLQYILSSQIKINVEHMTQKLLSKKFYVVSLLDIARWIETRSVA